MPAIVIIGCPRYVRQYKFIVAYDARDAAHYMAGYNNEEAANNMAEDMDGFVIAVERVIMG